MNAPALHFLKYRKTYKIAQCPLKAVYCLLLLTGSSFYSLPKEVCSVILDAECLRPIHTICNMVEPSKECQLVLRHFFNDSGVYCINVSMANDVSLAATSAKVNVDMGTQEPPCNSPQFWLFHLTICFILLTDSGIVFFVSGSSLSSSGTIAMVLGVLVLVLAAGIVAYSYKYEL